jgi:uncharacterized membrane protein
MIQVFWDGRVFMGEWFLTFERVIMLSSPGVKQ